MPVSQLYVEGDLDVIIMAGVVSTLPGGGPVIRKGNSKGSLGPKVADEREKGIQACYLRDRDFDTDPPLTLAEPTVDKIVEGEVRGWRWCRHEIENYLLEPGIVELATGWKQADFSGSLLTVAGSLRHYTAARWAVGTARRALPPLLRLATRPESLRNEIKVPSDRSEQASRSWASQHIRDFRSRVEPELADTKITETFEHWSQRLAAVSDPEGVLLCFPGKDLLAALEHNIVRTHLKNPVVFRNAIRDWILAHPAQAIDRLPEWSALLRSLM